MSSHDDIITRWVDVALGRTDRACFSRNRSNVFGEVNSHGARLYSYGHHFELARLVDAGKDGRFWLLNGDTYSVTTARHQGVTRNAVARTGLPVVIIPHAALGAAGIDLDTIRLVDVTDDRTETIPHEYRAGFPYVWRDGFEINRVSSWHVENGTHAGRVLHYNPADETRYVSPYDRAAWDVIQHALYVWGWGAKSEGWPIRTRETFADHVYFRGTSYTRPDIEVPPAVAAECAVRLIFSTFRMGFDPEPAGEDVVYRWNAYRHWLGESLIRARVRYVSRAGNRRNRWAYFLSGFDENERRPLYFLCELPKVDTAPTTVREAYRDLMPETVKLAVAMGKDVKRQGDIYAIPTELTTRQLKSMGATFGRKNHRIRFADGEPVDVYGPRLANRYPTDLERETHPMDYIAGIGHVIHGHQYVPKVATDLDDGTETARLLGTNHVGTYVARLPNGTTLARGTMTHDPGFRGPDHSRVTLGKAWHVILKNTVPVVR